MKQVKIDFYGQVKDGELQLDQEQQFKEYTASFEGKKVMLSLRNQRKTRSNQQNAYYWGCVIPLLSDVTGYDHEEMHEALKIKFLYQPRIVNEAELPTVKSTTELSTTDFMDFIEKIMRWAAEELNTFIPSPDGYFIHEKRHINFIS